MSSATVKEVSEAQNLIVRVPMEVLQKKSSWDFKADFESSVNDGDFNKFVKNCEVDIYCRRGKTTYVIIENGKEWGALDTGDDKGTCSDVAFLIQNKEAQVLNND